MIIKIILLILILVILVAFLKNRNTMKLRAGKKLLFVAFVGLSAVAVVDPDLLNDLAHAVGVGRGADLLLYGLVLAFCFVTLNMYLSLKDYDEKLSMLAREIAILQTRVDQQSSSRRK